MYLCYSFFCSYNVQVEKKSWTGGVKSRYPFSQSTTKFRVHISYLYTYSKYLVAYKWYRYCILLYMFTSFHFCAILSSCMYVYFLLSMKNLQSSTILIISLWILGISAVFEKSKVYKKDGEEDEVEKKYFYVPPCFTFFQ